MTPKKKFKVRGHEWTPRDGTHVGLSDLAKLYLVFRALDGDELAAELLNAAGTIVTDDNGTQLWPKKEGTK